MAAELQQLVARFTFEDQQTRAAAPSHSERGPVASAGKSRQPKGNGRGNGHKRGVLS
jgi:hypothetical protein